MFRKNRIYDLLPHGLVFEEEEIKDNVVRIFAKGSSSGDVSCPDCGVASSSVHSRYHRQLRDLPAHGRDVVIHVTVRRFRCVRRACRRKTFVEPLPEVIDHRYARRTSRAEVLLHRVALALGGRPGARLTERLCLRWSKDTLLRVLRRHAPVQGKPADLKVVGIDDWAWRRGQSYGTVICDLERHRIVALLAGRDADTAERWLKEHPGICVVARDRGGAYARATARALPDAVQVADRWHLFANASAAFLEAVRRSMKDIRRALGTTAIDPSLLTSAEKRQLAGARRRDETDRVILDLKEQGVSRREIARRVGCNRGTVRRVIDGRRGDVFRPRQSSLAPYTGMLNRHWQDGCHNGAELWRRLRAAGFEGSLRVVTEWATRRRHEEAASAAGVSRKCPSSRTIAKMMTVHRDSATMSDALATTVIEKAVPALVTARNLLDEFHAILRTRRSEDLDGWLARAAKSLLAPFVNGLKSDIDAVRAALTEPWSSGQVEGQNTKVKLVKRQMYGRAKMDLLSARLVQPA
jgi:transposase